jgi:hypothetical protein
MLLKKSRQRIFHTEYGLVLKLNITTRVLYYMEQSQLEGGVGLTVLSQKMLRLLSKNLVHREGIGQRCLYLFNFTSLCVVLH